MDDIERTDKEAFELICHYIEVNGSEDGLHET
jgi:hypothetical protein